MLTPLSSSGAASTITRKRPLESDSDTEDLNNKTKVRITSGKTYQNYLDSFKCTKSVILPS